MGGSEEEKDHKVLYVNNFLKSFKPGYSRIVHVKMYLYSTHTKAVQRNENVVKKKVNTVKLQKFSKLTNNLFDQDRVLKGPWRAGSGSIDGLDSN